MKAKKSLGQNFLIDQNIVKKIIKTLSNQKINNILEIGPGTGALTQEIVKLKNKNIIAVEIDADLFNILEPKYEENKNITIVKGDILKTNTDIFFPKENYLLIANLPYYISTKILFKFLNDLNCLTMTIMIQKELADRILSLPKKREYGRLTVALNTFFTIKKVTDVSPKAFKPRPKVNSSVLYLKRKSKVEIQDVDSYLDFIQLCFAKKRKTLYNNLKQKYTNEQIKQVIEKLFVDDWKFIRSEYIIISDFITMYKEFKKF